MNKQLHNEVESYLRQNFSHLAERAANDGDNSIYIELPNYTIDIELINNVEEVCYPGDRLTPTSYDLEGTLEVSEIRVYTEDDDMEFTISKELNKVLTINF